MLINTAHEYIIGFSYIQLWLHHGYVVTYMVVLMTKSSMLLSVFIYTRKSRSMLISMDMRVLPDFFKKYEPAAHEVTKIRNAQAIHKPISFPEPAILGKETKALG
jgi:hypothetical protein